MDKTEIIKKFNQLKEKHEKRLKGRKKSGAYAWDTEEERESRRNNNRERFQEPE